MAERVRFRTPVDTAGCIRSQEPLVPAAAPVSSQRLQAPAERHRSGLKQVAECGSSAQSAITSSFQLTAIFGKLSPRKAAAASNPHSRPTAHRSPAGSFIGGFRTPAPYTGPIARAGPASETLPDSSRF